ncbi:O-antigen translocase [Shewanella baltica]|uniref:O-antigen translocase n=1 Tax=Shewanella baltica TaxID=62322 RepID=UPI00217E9BD1|nr:O-antigen translocase [Shewanella baltica]MCS6159432.1 O-antigen translocase [Shewanella baltica]
MSRLLKVTALTALLTLLKMAMGFVIAKVVAIYTGPTGLAMLGQVQSMVSSLNGIINAPAGNGVVRFTAEHQEQGFEACAPWWRASLQWVVIISAIAIPIGLLLSNQIAQWLFQDTQLAWVVIATVCVLPLSAVGTLCNSVINGQQLYRRYVGLGMISVLISSGVMLGMIAFYNIQGALFAAAIQSALIGLLMLIANLRQPWFKLCFWWGSTDKAARKAIAGYMLMAITSALTLPVALILIRNMLISQVGWDATGQWQAVWKISEVYLSVITIALGTYYLPKLSSLSDVDDIINEIHKTIRIILPIVSFAALLVYLCRDVAISLLFTDEFRSARELFAFQLIGDVLKILGWLYAYPMLSRGTVKWFICTEVLFSISFILLSYLFISELGVSGVTLGYLFNYLFYLFFMFFSIKKIIA